VFIKLAKRIQSKSSNTSEKLPTSSISIVISAKNEAENLKRNLPFIFQQEKIDFEVIVIDDHSSDETYKILSEFQKKNSNLKIIQLADFTANTGKKIALSKAIELASYEILLFTDADCQPASKMWAYRMLQQLLANASTEVILGFGGFRKKNNFLNRLQNFETITTAIQYFSASLWKSPYMGVGRNLMYKKSLFLEKNGFKNHLDIPSGDDDLFVQEVANKENTQICLHPESFTISNLPTTWKAWFRQKQRHVTTSSRYSLKHQLLLGGLYFNKFIFWLSFVILLFTSLWFYAILGMTIITGIVYIIQKPIFKHFEEKRLLLGYPIYNFSLVLFQFCIFIMNLKSTPKHWN